MTTAGIAHEAVMRSIRDHLAASAPYDAVVHLGPPDVRARRAPLPIAMPLSESASPPIDRVHRFVEQLTGVGASCDIVRDQRAAVVALRRSLSTIAARRVVGSDSPLVQSALADVAHDVEIQAIADVSRDDLFACDAGITTAQLAIAETGTLVLESSREKNRLLSLVPPHHIAHQAAGDNFV
jgi:hypothetical protein